MKQHLLLQGSIEWHQHRATHFNASDAPAMLGISQYKTRNQLLHEMATGITPEIDEATQRRFDAGHRFEALARPLAEQIIGKKLYPVIGSEGNLSASFDGLTADDSAAFEHKSLNNGLREALSAREIPEQYRAQMEQQLMLSGAGKCLFMASAWKETDEVTDHFIETKHGRQYYELVEEMHQWYEIDPAMCDRLLQGWTQFAIDLESYQHVEHIEKPKAEVCIELPALFVHAKGEITTHNMKEFGEALQAKLVEVRAIALVTDQDFSNAKAAAKMFRDKAKEIRLAKEAMLSQTVTIGEAARMMDAWDKDLNSTALQLEKDVEREDLAKKRVMVGEAGIAFSAHVEALEAETRPIKLNVQRPNFAEAIKGKRNYTSMQDALDTALAQGKIEADAIAKDVRHKLANISSVSEYAFLFPDLQQFIFKPADDFTLIVTSRIKAHVDAEAERIRAHQDAAVNAERARIQAEEEAKAKAAQDALLAAERAKMEAEVHAKAEEEARQAQSEAAATAKMFAEVSKAEEAAATEERRKQAQIADQIKPVRLSGAKTVVAQEITPNRPSRAKLIAVIAFEFGVEITTAQEWLEAEFQTMKQAA